MLAQPIEIDAMMLVYFIVQFTGLYYFIAFLEQARESFINLAQPESAEEMSPVLTSMSE